MGLRVVGLDRKPIGVLRGLNREILVWVQGLGFGIPVVIPITMIFAYRNLGRHSTTSWDKKMSLVVIHRPAGLRQRILGITGAVLFVGMLLGSTVLNHAR